MHSKFVAKFVNCQ